jgi:glycolate oxidase FAD binding subunit
VITEQPSRAEQVAAALAGGRRARAVGGGTKLGWGAVGPEPELEISTAGLATLVEHNEGDLTAVVGAGMPLVRLQALLAEHDQRLALDPPDRDGRATIGGVFATGDSGPVRHRFGAPRDLILGVLVALPTGASPAPDPR